MPKVRQLLLDVESRPGVLAKVARTLGDAGVNIVAVCASESDRRGKIRLLLSDVEAGKHALRAARYRVAEEPAMTFVLDNRPGALADVLERLAQARIDVKSAYATGDANGLVVLSVSNSDKAEQVLRETQDAWSNYSDAGWGLEGEVESRLRNSPR